MQPKHLNRNLVPEIEPKASLQEDGWLGVGQGRHPAPANIQKPSDAELIGILQRALDGDPYPVSGRAPAPQTALPQTPALSDRIRDILGNHGAPIRQPLHIASMFERAAEPETMAPITEPEILFEPEEPAAELYVDDQREAEADITLVDIAAAEEDLRAIAAPAVTPQMLPRREWRIGWRSVAFVAVVAAAGALLPAVLAGPEQYRASTRLQLDRAGLAHTGFLDVVAQRIGSPELLSQVAAKLRLDRDPGFTGAHSGALGIVIDLFSGSGAASDAPSRAQAALKSALTIDENPATGQLALSVTTASAAKSARIANMLADAAVYDAVISQGASMPGQASLADAARKAYDQTAAALATFTKAAGEDKIRAAIDLQQQKAALKQQADDAAKAVADARIRLTATRGANLADVIDGSLSPDLRSSPALEDLRNRYAAARTTITALSAELGPRHPRLLAQQATADDLRSRIQTELQRLVSASEADVKSAIAEQKAAGDRLAALDKQDAGIDMIRFSALQDATEAARARYENVLQGGTVDKPSVNPLPLSVAMPAVAPAAPLDDNRMATQLAGFLTGLGIALCLVFLRIWLEEMLSDDEQASEVAEDRIAVAAEEQFADDCAMDHAAMLDLNHEALIPPQQVFAADILVDDRPAETRLIDQDIAALQDRMASLRAKVERYELARRSAQA